MVIYSFSEAIVDALRSTGVRTYFGIPGGQNLQLYRAIASDPTLINITARHEQGAAFMADGFYRATSETAGLLLVPGPGVANALAAMASADGDSVSMVVLAPWSSGVTKAWAIHEMRDQRRMLEGAIGDVINVDSSQDLAAALNELKGRLQHGRPHPVCLHFSASLLETNSDADWRPTSLAEEATTLDFDELVRAERLLCNAQRPLLIAGWGVICADAATEFEILVNRLGAASATSTKAKGAINPLMPGHLGCLWSSKTRAAVAAYDPDVTLALGTRFSHRTLAAGLPALGPCLIHVDIDPSVLGRNLPAMIKLAGDAKACITYLIDTVKRNISSILPTAPSLASGSSFVDNALRQLTSALVEEGCLVLDNSMIGLWAAKNLSVAAPRRCLLPMQACPLGYALPAAIGVSVRAPGKPTVVIGDGGLLFSIGELAVAVEMGIPLPIVVFNNSGYGSVTANEQFRFGTREIGIWRNGPDFVKIAHGFGAFGRRLDFIDDLGPAITEARMASRPTLIEIKYMENIPWPD